MGYYRQFTLPCSGSSSVGVDVVCNLMGLAVIEFSE
jgi:hypothetical protein